MMWLMCRSVFWDVQVKERSDSVSCIFTSKEIWVVWVASYSLTESKIVLLAVDTQWD